MTEGWRQFGPLGVVPQLDGSPFAGENCGAATWTMLAIANQLGKRPKKGSPWPPTPSSIRTASGDRSGGILPSTLDATLNRVYGIDLIPRITTAAAIDALLTEGYDIGLLYGYRPVSDAGFSGSPGFYGAHSGALLGQTTSAWLVGDPLYDGRRRGIPKGPQWIARTTMVAAAGALVLDSSGTTLREKYGRNAVYIVQTTVPYRPSTPTSPPLAGVVASAPATAAERRNTMIHGAYGVTSAQVQNLAKGQPLFASPGGPKVTAMSAARAVTFLGVVGPKWGVVVVGTAVPYKDGKLRPTGLYVPLAAGRVVPR